MNAPLSATATPAPVALSAVAYYLLGRVPMTWMGKTAGPFPLYLAGAAGARVTDLDGHDLADFCLGDTGAMAGHSPGPVVEAVTRRLAIAGGATAMLPTEDAEVVAADLTRRFGVGQWSFSLSATHANRWALRLSRNLTGRPKVLVHSECYHGSVDESFVVATPDGTRPRPGTEGGPGEVTNYSRAVEFNDLDAMAAELADGEVAAVLMEPALTNIGIVLPEPGYLDGVRALTRDAGTLLIIDETHTLSAWAGGRHRGLGPRARRRHAGQGHRRGPARRGLRVGRRRGPAGGRLRRVRPDRRGRRRWHPRRQRAVRRRHAGHPHRGPDR